MSMPGPLRRGLNLLTAVAGHAADGFQSVTAEQYLARLAVCEGCDLLRKSDMVCQHQDCGCYVKTKAGWRSEDCPEGKWGPVPAAPNEGAAAPEGQPPARRCGACGS